MITDDVLTCWQSVCDMATPGPWFVHIFEEETDWPTVYTYARGKDGDDLVAETYYWQADAFTGHHKLTTLPEATAQANAEFIAMARTAVPALIAEVRWLWSLIMNAGEHPCPCGMTDAWYVATLLRKKAKADNAQEGDKA